MPFDGLTLSVTVQEIHQVLEHARIMKIYQPGPQTILLHLRQPGKNYQLMIAADPAYPRMHLTEAHWKNPQNPPAFCMLLRKYLEPSRVIGVFQHGLERVVAIELEAFAEDGTRSDKRLVFELLGRHSNILLLNADKIIFDAVKRIPADKGQDRVLEPGAVYKLPSDQGKRDPSQLTQDAFIELLRFLPAQTTLQQALQNTMQGFSGPSAQEAVVRAGLDPQQSKQSLQPEQWPLLWDGVQQLIQEVRRGGNPSFWPRQKVDFSGYSQQREGAVRFETMNQLLDHYYTHEVTRHQLQQRARDLLRTIKTQQKRVKRKEKAQMKAIQDAKDAEKWQRYGELLTANLYRIEQGSEAEVQDFYDPEQSWITIPMDPTKTPNENAQQYFKKYSKAKTSLDVTSRQLRKTRREKRYLEELAAQVELADSQMVLDEIRDEMIQAGYLKRRPARGKRTANEPSQPEEFVSSDGYTILVGRSNYQNDRLTFQIARPNEYWFHAQKIPGSHVVVKGQGPLPDSTIEEAALLAARYSKASASPKVPVDYTQRKHVRKPSGGAPGFVLYDHFQTVTVNPTAQSSLPQRKPKKEA